MMGTLGLDVLHHKGLFGHCFSMQCDVTHSNNWQKGEKTWWFIMTECITTAELPQRSKCSRSCVGATNVPWRLQQGVRVLLNRLCL